MLLIFITFNVYSIISNNTIAIINFSLGIFFMILINGIAIKYKINVIDKYQANPLKINASFSKRLCIRNKSNTILLII